MEKLLQEYKNELIDKNGDLTKLAYIILIYALISFIPYILKYLIIIAKEHKK